MNYQNKTKVLVTLLSVSLLSQSNAFGWFNKKSFYQLMNKGKSAFNTGTKWAKAHTYQLAKNAQQHAQTLGKLVKAYPKTAAGVAVTVPFAVYGAYKAGEGVRSYWAARQARLRAERERLLQEMIAAYLAERIAQENEDEVPAFVAALGTNDNDGNDQIPTQFNPQEDVFDVNNFSKEEIRAQEKALEEYQKEMIDKAIAQLLAEFQNEAHPAGQTQADTATSSNPQQNRVSNEEEIQRQILEQIKRINEQKERDAALARELSQQETAR